VSSKNVLEALTKIEEILHRFDNWCSENGLSTNYSKTKCMIIRNPQTKLPSIPKLFIGENEIEYVSTFKYLGVHLDEFFSLRNHIEHVYSKVNCGLIRKLRRYLTEHAFCILVNAYIFSAIDYCLIVWGPSRRADFDSLQKKVNQLLVIFFYPSVARFYREGCRDVTVGENN
jgi:hypothetical protein